VGALDGNIWVCAECRSINNEGAKQCYNCRTPRDLAAVDPSTIQGTGHGKLRDIALPPFHSPRPYAALASIAILATAGIQVIYTLDFTSLVLQGLGGTPATDEQLRFMGMIGLVTLAIGVTALVLWSLWLSRAVAAMPALGLGYPAATGLTAFVENFLPGLNLLRVPAIVRDVVRRVEPGSGRGEALIFAAWIGLLGGFVVPRVFGILNGISAETEEAALRTQLTIQGISIGLVLVGAIFLVALIWWIEERIARRREAQLAAIDAATAGGAPEPADATDEGVAIPALEPRIASAQPSTTRWSWGDSGDSPLAASMDPAAAGIGTAAGWDAEPVQRFPPNPAPMVQATGVPDVAVPPPAGVPASPQPASAAEPPAAPQPAVEPPPAPQPAVEPPPPVAAVAPRPEPAAPAVPEPEPTAPAVPAQPEPPPTVEAQPMPAALEVPPQPAPAAPVTSAGGTPHLTIRIVNRGMLQAEMAGESEPVILEDLTAYGEALANAGGTAQIVVAGNDGMATLIARRAQRILAETGIEASIAD
jgi:hypothetical protein